jgi:hypothetical protein
VYLAVPGSTSSVALSINLSGQVLGRFDDQGRTVFERFAEFGSARRVWARHWVAGPVLAQPEF